jgi:ATP-binding protein involved in chromosome partitioning
VKIPVLGLIENMSYFVCDGCDKKHFLFDHGGAQAAAETMEIPFLGELPLVMDVRECGDRGMPIVEAMPESPIAIAFTAIALDLAKRIVILNEEGEALADKTGPSKAARRSLPVVG